MKVKLTDRQQAVFDYLRQTQVRTGIIPSSREIQQHFGFASQTAAMSHLRALERKGVIHRVANKARAVVFPDDLARGEIINVPLYGNIAAGMAQNVEPVRESCVAVDGAALGICSGTKTFALRVRGESMIGAHICDGDIVIMEVRAPNKGAIVAALIDGETTLKRYVIERGKPFLHAENPNFPDLIPAHELLIQGVMVGLLREGE